MKLVVRCLQSLGPVAFALLLIYLLVSAVGASAGVKTLTEALK